MKISSMIIGMILLTSSFLPVVQAAGTNASATPPLPTGLWRAYDKDNQPRNIIRFYVVNNKLQAKVEKILSNLPGSDDICRVCPSPWKNKPKKGMVIIWGLKQDGNHWVDGTVLDTDNGEIYHCQVSLSPDNKTMYFRAYVFTPLLGITVNWERIK